MTSDNSQQYWEAMEDEVRNLEKRKTWSYVDKSSVPSGTYIVPELGASEQNASLTAPSENSAPAGVSEVIL